MTIRHSLFSLLLVGVMAPIRLEAQLNQNCTACVLNRCVRANADGSWVLPNIPAGFGQVKARATCVQGKLTTAGESAFFSVTQHTAVNLPEIVIGSASPIPVSLAVTPGTPLLTSIGQSAQLTVTARFADSSTKNVTAGSTGTNCNGNCHIAFRVLEGLFLKLHSPDGQATNAANAIVGRSLL